MDNLISKWLSFSDAVKTLTPFFSLEKQDFKFHLFLYEEKKLNINESIKFFTALTSLSLQIHFFFFTCHEEKTFKTMW